MKNSKSILLILSLLFSIIYYNGFGQKFYFKAGLGGGYGINGSEYTMNSNSYTDSTYSTSKSSVRFLSLGSGLNTKIAVGRNFGKNFSFEINLGFFYRIPVKMHTIDNYSISGHDFTAKWEYKYSGHAFSLIPAIIFSPGFEKFNPYCKIGFIVAKGTLKEKDSVYVSGNGIYPQGDVQKWKHFSNLYYGLKTALGFEYPISKRTKIFVEVAYDNITFKPSKSTLTDYTSNGTNMMGSMNTMHKEIVYVDQIFPESAPDINQPLQLLKQKLSYNTISIDFGFKFQ